MPIMLFSVFYVGDSYQGWFFSKGSFVYPNYLDKNLFFQRKVGKALVM